MPRGQKECPQCQHVCGPRSYNCPQCNHDFGIENKEQEQKVRRTFSLPQGFVPPEGVLLTVVDTPAGLPPIRLRQHDYNLPANWELQEWARDVRHHQLQYGHYLTNKALTYWARHELNRDLRFKPAGPEMLGVKTALASMADLVIREERPEPEETEVESESEWDFEEELDMMLV